MWKLVLPLLRLSLAPIRHGFVFSFLLLLLLAMSVVIIELAAGNDPHLQRPARYMKLVLMCLSALAPLAFIVLAALLFLRRRSD